MLQINLSSTRDPIVQTKINLSEEVWNENKQNATDRISYQPTNDANENLLLNEPLFEWKSFKIQIEK